MACTSTTLKGIVNDCETSKGGIKAAWIANYGDIVYGDVTDGKIAGITLGEGQDTGAKPFHNVYFKKNTGNFVSTLNVDATNGTNYVSTEIALVFTKMETKKRIAVAAMAVADMVVVVEDANGKYWAFGYDEPVTTSASTGNTGTNAGDGNNYQITLLDEANTYPYELSDTAISALVKDLTVDETA